MPIIEPIIEQHAGDAAFCWLLRESAVGAPHYEFKELAALDDRIEANLDGLRIAGDAGWDICRAALAIGEPGEVFTAGLLAFETLIPERMDGLLATVEPDPELQRALASAMGWIGFETIGAPAQRLISADLDFLKRIGLSAFALHRRDPGALLPDLVEAPAPAVRARALKAAGELGRLDLLPVAMAHLQDQDAKCRFYAAWSANLLGGDIAMDRLAAFAAEPGAFALRACDLAARRMPPAQAIEWLRHLTGQTGSTRSAVGGLGALGDPAAVPWLLEMMHTPELARPAGDALAMITGLDIAYENLEAEPPEGFTAGPTDDPADEDVAPDPDEDLPWPDPELIARWWSRNGTRLRPGTRHLCGKPISRDHCREVLRTGHQWQRAAAALELCLMAPGQPLFEIRAPGFRQARLLTGA